MFRIFKICFWIAVVVFFLPEDPSNNKNGPGITTEAIENFANVGAQNISDFCKRNPKVCLKDQKNVGIAQKTIKTARSIYEFLQDTPSIDIDQKVVNSKVFNISDQINAINSSDNTLTISDFKINLSTADVQ